MATCQQCGNNYDKSFIVRFGDTEYTFDSFECAIQALAPACVHCGTKIIGHGVEKDNQIYCCASCAAHAGVTGLKDRA